MGEAAVDVTSGQEFFNVLEKSRLLSSEQQAEAERRRAAAPEKTAAEWAKEFVALGWLTDWQARQLLCGRHALFMGKYKLLDRLGGGGMGIVFTAHHAMTDRVVALKVMNKSIVSNPLAMARFKAEVRLLCALSHPNIIAAYDADAVGNTNFLVMEYGRGQDLRVWLQKHETLPIDWVSECIRQAALGLEHARQRGLVHRDIKPENLLVEDEQPFSRPAVKILDLGLARWMGAEAPEEAALREAGQIMGTADYIAPEQVEETELADARSDIFSLGCTMFKLLAGRLPFEGANAAEKLLVRVTQDAPALSQFRPEIPPGLDAIVARMLKRSPNERYQTPAEVAEALYPFTIEGKFAAPIPPPLPPPIATPPAVSAPPAAPPITPDAKAADDRDLDSFFSRLSSEAEMPSAALPAAAGAAAAGADEVEAAFSLSGSVATATEIAPPPIASTPSSGALPRPAPKQAATQQPAPSYSPATAPAGRFAKLEPRQRNWLLGVGLGVALSIPVVVALAFFLRPVVLELDWPLDERSGSRLDVDGQRVAIPVGNPAVVTLKPGDHRIVIRRRGYEQLDWSVSASRGERIERKVEWKEPDLRQGFGFQGTKE